MTSHPLLTKGTFRASALATGLAAAAITLAGCASSGNSSSMSRVDPSTTTGSLSKYRVQNWKAVDDQTILIQSSDGSTYKAMTIGPCHGLDFSNRVAFENRGGFQQIDQFSSVVLADGTRCRFQSFERVKTAEATALDSFEKLSNEKNLSDQRR